MKTGFRVLTVLHFLLVCAALVLGNLLFQKREILKGRTQKLEAALRGLAATFESGEAQDRTPPSDLPARDVGDVSATAPEPPEVSTFWQRYRFELENAGAAMPDLARRAAELATYYRIDPVTLKPMRDPVTDLKVTDGPGTMQQVLDDVLACALAQHNRLNETRGQLRALREELVDTVAELNGRKRNLRETLATVVARDAAIAGLHNTVRQRDESLRECHEEIVGLRDQLGEREMTVAQQKERIDILVADVSTLRHELDVLKATRQPAAAATWRWMRPGVKGEIVGTNGDWNFAVLKLSEEFVNEYATASRKLDAHPEVDLHVYRNQAGRRVYVAKVRVDRLYPDRRLAAVTPVPGSLQSALRQGDEALY